MSRMIFVNLPVQDLDASKAYFAELGFTFNAQFTDDSCACMFVNDQAYVMLLRRERFADFVEGEIADGHVTTEVLTCLSADSREDVDALAEAAVAAGGSPWRDAMDLGFMYGRSFQDLDGHVWEVMWMDPAVASGEVRPEALEAAA